MKTPANRKQLFGASFLKEVSNNFLSRLFTVEFFVAFLGLVFAVGVTWSSVQSEVKAVQIEVQATNKKFDELKKRQNRLDSAVGRIQTDIEVIKTNQVHAKETIEETKKMVRELLNSR